MNKLVSWATIVVIMAGSFGCSKPKPIPTEITFVKDFQQAKALALKDNKPMIIDFYTDWCKWCKLLDTTTYADSQVIAMSTDIIFVKLNAENDSAIARSYGIQGYPTIVIARPNGETIDQIKGYVAPKDFLTMARLYLQNKGTLEDYLTRLQTDSTNIDYLMAVSDKYINRAQFENAIEYCRKVIALDPDNQKSYGAKAMASIANIRELTKDYSGAMAACQDIIVQFPDTPEADDAAAMLGYFTFKQGDLKGALQLYRDYLAKYPSGRNGWVYSRIADLEENL